MNPDLQQFVREALSRGLARPAIREQLLAAGWRPEEVEPALAAFAETDFPVPVPRRRPYLSAREAFLYLVLFATLYISAFDLGLVLFSCLDRWLPDAVTRDYAWRAAVEGIRGGIAGLVIAFPIFLFVATLIGRAMAREPEKRGSKVRKWLTYVTLFVAALVIIGDLSFLVQRLLSGELPARVLWKTLVVLAIAGTIFGHYLADLRGEEGGDAVRRRRVAALAWTVVAVVVATVVAGLLTAGSPRQARHVALDEQRVRSLDRIRELLEKERGRGERLPVTLDELARRPGAPEAGVFVDPETFTSYEYRVLDSATVELGATFATVDSSSARGREGARLFWRHPRGPYRFTVPLGRLPAVVER